jgi:hypothetical protein
LELWPSLGCSCKKPFVKFFFFSII